MKLEWKTCLRVGVSVFLLYLCMHYWQTFGEWIGSLLSAAGPMFMGFAIAYVINIPMRFYEHQYHALCAKRFSPAGCRPICMALAYLSFTAVVMLVLRIVVPELGECIRLLVQRVPPAMEQLSDTLANSPLLTEWFSDTLQQIDWKQMFDRMIAWVQHGMGGAADFAVTVVSVTFSTLTHLLIAFIFSIYFLSGKERLCGQLKRLSRRYIPLHWCEKIQYLCSVMDSCFHRYLVGQCTEAVILGLLCALGMLLLGFPYAAVVGATVGLTALIPVAGAYIGGAVGFLLILTVSPIQAVLFLIYLVVLQQLEGNLIYPRVVGASLGLPGVWVLAAVVIGGGLGGIWGMIVGVPLAACAYQLIREDVNRNRETTTSPIS